MTSPRQPTAAVVGEVLAALQQLLDGDDRYSGQVEELQRRRREDVLRLLVVGEAKRGKSSLLNALLGVAVLPTGVVPLTSVATVLRYGPAAGCTVRFGAGQPPPWPLERLAELVTQPENLHNRRGSPRSSWRCPARCWSGWSWSTPRGSAASTSRTPPTRRTPWAGWTPRSWC